MAAKAESLIPASWFCGGEGGKSKLSWLLYEYALKLYDEIAVGRGRALSGWKAGLGDKDVAEFCAYFAKRMRQSVLDHTGGVTAAVEIKYGYARDYCHGIEEAEIDAVMGAAASAWSGLLEGCAVCPTACMSDPYGWCELFGRVGRGGYLS